MLAVRPLSVNDWDVLKVVASVLLKESIDEPYNNVAFTDSLNPDRVTSFDVWPAVPTVTLVPFGLFGFVVSLTLNVKRTVLMFPFESVA